MSGEDDHPMLAYLIGGGHMTPPVIQVVRGEKQVKVEMTEDMLWEMARECLNALARIRRDRKRKTTVVQG